jgi:sulfotransferase
LMTEDGAIVKEIRAIKNAFKYPKMCHFIKYDDMVADPEKTFIQLYKFLDEPYYPHQFQNLKQININDIEYDDTVLGKNMHKIRTVVKKQINNYVVPESIKRKYEHIKI